MPRRWLRVVKAAALAAVMLGGGGGMPLLDVALYHVLAPSRSNEAHYEPSGADCHAELCRLDSKVPYSPQAESLDLRVRPLTTPFRALALTPRPPRPADHRLLPPPRAPPGLPA
ncbi:MAG TPA: hypothetical protein VFR62_07635 [Gemmatimonadales bacterium]|nr:hypothetical protein [Gemmatimonadales bacterium]